MTLALVQPSMFAPRDGEEPRSCRFRISKGVYRTPRAQECLLNDVLRYCAVAREPKGKAKDIRSVSGAQPFEPRTGGHLGYACIHVWPPHARCFMSSHSAL